MSKKMSDRTFRLIMLSLVFIICMELIIVKVHDVLYTKDGEYYVYSVKWDNRHRFTLIDIGENIIREDRNFVTVIIPGRIYYIKWKDGFYYDFIKEWSEIK